MRMNYVGDWSSDGVRYGRAARRAGTASGVNGLISKASGSMKAHRGATAGMALAFGLMGMGVHHSRSFRRATASDPSSIYGLYGGQPVPGSTIR